jgi:hypothetical protein
VSGDAEIVDGPTELMPEDGMRVFSYRVRHGDAVHDNVCVAIPAALMAASPDHPVVASIVAAKGRTALERSLAKGRVPERLTFRYLEANFGEPD